MKRRTFLGIFAGGAATTAATGTLAQDDNLPECTVFEEYGENRTLFADAENFNTKGSWRLRTYATTQSIRGTEYPVSGEIEHGSQVVVRGDSDGFKSLSFELARPAEFPGSEEGGTEFFVTLYRGAHAEFFFDGVSRADSKDLSGSIITLDNPPDWFANYVLDSSSLRIVVTLSTGGEAIMDFDLKGLRAAAQRSRETLATQLEEVRAYGDCDDFFVPCVMTTATVDMLGRPDDGFELAALRQLRARFGHETEVLAEYVATSHALLARPQTFAFRLALMAFYATTILPTAALVRLGALRAARATYLTGFAALKAVLGHR